MTERILVTGAGGFVGRELLRQLALREELTVVALDANPQSLPVASRLEIIRGDLTDPACRRAAIGSGVDALVHLAAVPGGAAEADPVRSQRVNVEATLDLLREVASSARRPRVVFASTIAVYGDPLPQAGVDDSTPPAPRLIYGAHKAMIETMIATLTRRQAIDGLSLRLPGIIARPRGAAGMKSAFLSEVFHALKAGESLLVPVSPAATMWLMSVRRCAQNIGHALQVDPRLLPATRACALPALRLTMAELVAEVARQLACAAASIRFAPDEALEQAFGRYPPLTTRAAQAAGFRSDETVAALVRSALESLETSEAP